MAQKNGATGVSIWDRITWNNFRRHISGKLVCLWNDNSVNKVLFFVDLKDTSIV